MPIPQPKRLFSWLPFFNRLQTVEPGDRRNVADFLTDLQTIAPNAGRGHYAFKNPEGSAHGYVQFIIHSHRQVEIHRLWTHNPGQGKGSLMIKSLCDLADRHDVDLSLKVLPIGRKPYPLSRQELKNWYQRYGFVGPRWKLLRQPITLSC